ncbi:MAG: hypothetical protein WAP51_05140 [Candidatus Sungiibacteriota bacterium]
MPKRNLPSGTKVKRLSLYPKQVKTEAEETPEAEEAPEAPKAKPVKRWVPTRERPEMKAPERLPYYRELPPRYEQPAPPPPEVPAPVDNTASIFFGGFFIIILVVIAVVIGGTDDGGGGGGGGGGACPEQSRISGCGTIRPDCKCPANCPYYFIIGNPPSLKGYKQCKPTP